jgi:hypothetical protein
LSGYAEGGAQIPQANDINDKSRPNSTMNIHDSSGCAGGAAQIHTTGSQTSTIHQVIPEVLPKFLKQMIKISTILQATPKSQPNFNWRTQLMTSLITILLVMPEALPKFHRQTQLMTDLVPI